ncbi:unnamed protein product [Polarella glacialis]|uniref:Methyltransferase type 12 domain-containing protein n=1 Tax=Polarella glacialis TaxID=89957 RepID=A0A813K2R1_POLGL|nr:unnamed protein product [Polarella glacialis]
MFDWCEGYERLATVVEATLELAGEGRENLARSGREDITRVLDVGCGTSTLAASLWASCRRRVHAVDVDPAVIEAMRESHAGCDGLTWEVVDLTAAGDALGQGVFDVAIDKGTLDFLICSGIRPVLDALASVRRSLREDGVLLVVSIHPLGLWQALFAALAASAPALGFDELASWSLEAQSADSARTGIDEATVRKNPTSALALRRRSQEEADSLEVDRVSSDQLFAAAEAAAGAALDKHFAVEAPLLTPRREASLRADFAAALAAAGEGVTRLAASEAHRVLFPSSAEQAEYPLDLFLEDLTAQERSATSSSGGISLSLAEAIDFLTLNQ